MSDPTWITLTDAKRYLRFDPTETGDDISLQLTVSAAAAMIEDIKGHVQKGAVTAELHEVEYPGAVFLDERPVASVQAVNLYRGDGSTVAIAANNPATPALGYRLVGDAKSGVLQLPPFGPNRCTVGDTVSVDYTFGLDTIPANYIEAALELIAHLWKTSQENTSGGRPGLGQPDLEWERGGAGSGNYALPFRVRELLGIFGAVVKSSGVRVL